MRPATAWRIEIRETTKLALPLMLAQAAVMVMGIVDTLVVGRLAPDDLGAVSLGISVGHGIMVLGLGVVMVLETLVSQALGAGDPDRAWAWWKTGVRAGLLFGAPLTAAGILLCAETPALGIDAPLAARAVEFLYARAPGFIVFLPFIAARSVLQSYGRTRSLVVAAIVANVFNAITDVLMVPGGLGLPALGGVGAGLATSVSTAIMLAILLVDLRTLRPAGAATPPAKGSLGRLVRLGLPLSAQLAAEYLVFSTIGVLAAAFGKTSAAAHTIALHCSTLTFMAAIGIGGATTTRVGYAVGRGDGVGARRAGLVGMTLTLALMTSSAIVFLALHGPIAALFAPDEPPIRVLAGELIAIAGLYQLFDGLQVVMAAALRGAGDLKRPLLITAVAYWGVGFPVAYGLAFGGGLEAPGLWYGLTAGLAAAGLALLVRFVYISGRAITPVGA
ncbi:MAG: MATE family efflux transporter [Deltaproteobacteria bacterium]|nr:MATE family efflux transporter [Deltaproteobacteria bacterium]